MMGFICFILLSEKRQENFFTNTPLGTERSPLPEITLGTPRVKERGLLSVIFAYSAAIKDGNRAIKSPLGAEWYHSVPSGTTRYRVDPFSGEYPG